MRKGMRTRIVILAMLLPTSAWSHSTADRIELRNGESQSDWEQRWFKQFGFVQDAMRRWALKNDATIETAMRARRIQVMEFPTKVCVQFESDVGSVGGTPVYCYKRTGPTERWTQLSQSGLIEEYSDVE